MSSEGIKAEAYFLFPFLGKRGNGEKGIITRGSLYYCFVQFCKYFFNFKSKDIYDVSL